MKCEECGSTDLQWNCHQATNSQVVDGRLRLHEIYTQFFLRCNYCSETLQVVGGDKVAEMMTDALGQLEPE